MIAGDLSELEEEARQAIPPENYGIAGYLLSEDHKMHIGRRERQVFMKGHVDMNTGYNCYMANSLLTLLMRKRGSRTAFAKGQDSLGLFGTHFFCVDDDGDTLDAIPIYSFRGELHEARTFPPPDKAYNIYCVNPWRVHDWKGEMHMLSFDMVCPHYPKGISPTPFDGETLEFCLRDTVLGPGINGYSWFRLHRSPYRHEFEDDFASALSDPEASLAHMLDK